MRYLGTKVVIAIENYVDERADVVINLPENQDVRPIRVIKIPHPSPLTRMSEDERRKQAKKMVPYLWNGSVS